ncbi:MAG: LicD family protein [Bacteroidales bacterium]|nr:LicD family protein [Bacteroidales bacterium]
MKELTISEMKRIQIEILNVIDEFCKKNKIRYSMGYGTLLGAIRHKGYIPWDDDLDIIMPYPDYCRFLNEFNHKDSYLKIQSMLNDTSYRFPFAKVYDDRTLLLEKTIKTGVYIDIFPVVGFPKEEDFEKFVKEYHKKYMLLRSMTKRYNLNWFQKCLLMLKSLYTCSRKKIIEDIQNIYSRYPFDKAVNAGVIPNKYIKRRFFNADIFRHYALATFENREYSALADYDTYLKGTYGNYMQLPPEEKRHSEHIFKAYWK